MARIALQLLLILAWGCPMGQSEGDTGVGAGVERFACWHSCTSALSRLAIPCQGHGELRPNATCAVVLAVQNLAFLHAYFALEIAAPALLARERTSSTSSLALA
jgi:hypothetical protein